MKRLSIILFILCPVIFLAGVWVPAVFWQCTVTALVVLFAGISAAVAYDQREAATKEHDQKAPGLTFTTTPARPTMTQAQIDAELERITKGQGGHQ